MPPFWFVVLASLALGTALLCCLYLLIQVLRHPRKMAVMNWVWPITALYFGPVAIVAYHTLSHPRVMSGQRQRQRTEQRSSTQAARQPERDVVGSGVARSAASTERAQSVSERYSADSEQHQNTQQEQEQERSGSKRPYWQTVWVGVTHCGAGCTLGDLIAEWTIFFVGVRLAGTDYWPNILLDYALAYLLGIAFQYFAIAPMRGISGLPGIWAAIKADTLSLTAFEVGLFAWMALTAFVIFPHLHPDTAAFWFMMQLGMLIGFATSYPMNWWLIRRGIKEAM